MKKNILVGFVLVAFLTIAVNNRLSAQHIAPLHGHSNSTGVCWGYAMGRSAGKAEGNAGCNPSTMVPLLSAVFSYSSFVSKKTSEGICL